MKTWKSVLFGIVAIIAFGFAFLACDDGNGKEEQPEFREKTIILDFTTYGGWVYDSGDPVWDSTIVNEQIYSANVQGTLTQSQWNGVADKIKTAIMGAYGAGNAPVKGRLRNAFGNSSYLLVSLPDLTFTREWVTIIIDGNADYESYKVDDARTTRFNSNYLSNASDLETIILAVTDEMNNASVLLPANWTHFNFDTGTIGGSNLSTITDLTIPAAINGVPVVSIGDHAFQRVELTSVIIPDSVTTIGLFALWTESGSLTKITIGANVSLSTNNFDESVSIQYFDDFYISNGKKAGTYLKNSGGNPVIGYTWTISGTTPCNCTEAEKAEHYLPCDCEAAGTDKCDCEVVPRGYLTDATRLTMNIPIYQTAYVSNEDAATTVTNIQTAWDYLNPSTKEHIATYVNKIEMIVGTEVTFISARWISEILQIGTGASLSVIAESLDDLVVELTKPIATIFYNDNEIAQNGLIDAGSVAISQSTIITIFIKNTGIANLTISAIDILIMEDYDTRSTEFTKITNPAQNLTYNVETQFMIQFTPSKTGEHNATMSIPTNDNNRNPVVVLLKGTGIE
jgi:hypothetical protein